MNPPTRPSLAVVILGAGASVRMGAPKLLLPWRNTTVIGGILSQWRELGATAIGIVLRPDDTALGAELDRVNFPRGGRIQNPQPERGMFSSIICAAKWNGWPQETTHWAVVLGDQPHLRMETLKKLVEFQAQNMSAICQPMCGGRLGHPVIMPALAWAGLKLTHATTLKEYLKLPAVPRVHFEVADAGLLLDMDTPEDYKRLKPADA